MLFGITVVLCRLAGNYGSHDFFTHAMHTSQKFLTMQIKATLKPPKLTQLAKLEYIKANQTAIYANEFLVVFRFTETAHKMAQVPRWLALFIKTHANSSVGSRNQDSTV